MRESQESYPLLRFHEERPLIVRETARRALDLLMEKSEGAPEYILNDACLQEIRRLSESSGRDEVRDLSAWRRLWRSLGTLSYEERVAQLGSLIEDYVEDVAGGFDRRVYNIASRMVPPALGILLTPEGLRGAYRALSSSGVEALLSHRLRIEGPVSELGELSRFGTLVCVPTHVSNLDSPVMGYALQLSLLPPTTYGAGKNLFTNPVLGFFMRKCGAYRVDRRIKHELYKDVLKTYSQVILERGYHSMFFPGGTRSRSGGVEEHVKLGLLGTTLPATVARFRRSLGLDRGPAIRPMYLVPATINFQLVLEAETLIADFLSETGKARYIIEDDESAQALRVLSFARSLLRLSGAVVVRFGRPMDVLGNPVDRQGQSLDPRGRPVDLSRYFYVDGEPRVVPQRDAEYMRETGVAIMKSYRENTVLMPTHLVARVAWQKLCNEMPNLDLYHRLRHSPEITLREEDVLADIDRLRAALRSRGHLLDPFAEGPAREVLETALMAFGSYHKCAALERSEEDPGLLVPRDRQLLYYYQNRIDSLKVPS